MVASIKPALNLKMKRLKIGIRTQLIILVAFLSLFSLLILGIVTGVYFSSNLTHLQSERLELVSNLKSTQVRQAIQYIEYQIYFLSTRDTLASPLESYRAGNYSSSVFDNAESTIGQFLQTSDTFAAAKLYDLSLNEVVNYYNNDSNIPTPTLDYLFPLKKNGSVPSPLSKTGTSAVPTYITGPIANDSSNLEGAYFMGVTIPVYSNNSIILDEPYVAGYLTVIANTQNIQYSLEDVSTVDSLSTNYTIIAIAPIYYVGANTSSTLSIVGYDLVFPSTGLTLSPGTPYNVNNSDIAKLALYEPSGSSTNIKNEDGVSVAIGFSQINTDSEFYWSIIVSEKRKSFMSPIKKLQNIIIGVVIGLAVFICLITFPLAVWFIRPITKLKEATEAITNSKKKKPSEMKVISPNGSTGGQLNTNSPTQLDKRNSFMSNGSSAINSVYSSGIRLPRRIPNSKKFFKDELTELTEAFNIMTEELDKQYTYLEDRVRLRTRELEASKIEAEKANEAKTVFIANISHELRTPLNGILGMTSIAMDEKDHSIIQDSLKLIHRSGELLLHILTELLTYSKNTLNRSKLEKSNFQILEIVYQVKSIFSKIALDQRVRLKIILKPSVIRQLILHGDSNRIIQILMNLVSNSMKFTPVDGSIDVSFKLLGEYDYEKSKASNFSKVYIKHTKNKDLSDELEETEPKKIEEIDTELPTSNEENKDITEQVSTNTRARSASTKEDNISVLTLSTAEYQNQLFNSQFHYAKPLPNIPSASSIHSEHTAIMSNETKSDAVSSSHLETFNENNREHNFNSKMSHNELVKNNKAYKLRHIYKPKTWVLQFQVKDTGPGIEPALQQKVFEPFIQGDQSLSRSHGGTGLGLSICMQLAKMMNGTLSLDSTVGVGSTFTFTVPLLQTGEIIVKPEDLEEFCDDEFNPNAKMNRKVAFEENIPLSPSDDTVPDNENTENNEFHDAQEVPLDNQGSQVADSNVANTLLSDNLAVPSIEIDGISSSPNASPNKSLKLSDNNLITFKLDILKESIFEKPMMLAVSSTGTASSSRKNFIKDVKNINILVAEDNMVNQEVIKRMLKLEGFEAITMAGNGAEAIDFVKASFEEDEYYDLIFMDVQMPKIDGLQATRTIRNELHYSGPIIALTAFADESNVKECLNCGMSGFLSKPIKRKNLRQIIHKFCPDMLGDFIPTPKQHGEEKTLGYVAESN